MRDKHFTNGRQPKPPESNFRMTGREILRAINTDATIAPTKMEIEGGLKADPSILFGTYKDTVYGVSFDSPAPTGPSWFTPDEWLLDLIANGNLKVVDADILEAIE
jgi:hypothetical protein